jgi:hypothetical protein
MRTKALTCEEVRPLLARLVASDLRLAERGHVEGHLYDCDECADSLGQILAEAIVAGRAAKAAARSYPETFRARGPKVLMWHRHRTVTPALFREHYRAALSSLPATRGIALDGESPVELSIQVIDRSWNAVDVEPVRSYLVAPPVFTPEGEFRMTIELVEQDLARCEGRSIICLVKISDDSCVGFETLVTSSLVAFAEAGLPSLDDFASPAPELFDLYLTI